jgi:nitrite reductase (NADH) large subunit
MPKQRLVVIGNGMAGARLVEEVLARGGAEQFKIAIFSDEANGSYDRMRLADVMNGSQDAREILLRDFAWYKDHDIQLNAGQRVLIVSRPARTVYGSTGTAEPYDQLVFATGSSPYFPPLQNLFNADGQRLAGITGFRTLADCATISALASESRRVVVIGGGLLALEAARGLAKSDREVHLIHSGPQLMSQQLDEYAGEIVRRLVENAGIRVHLNRAVRGLTGQRRVNGIVLSDGSVMDCELVVVSAGLIPNTWLAYQCGLTVERGIAVDNRLRSLDDSNVHALGECAQLRDRVHGSGDAIVAQARVIAAQLVEGDSSARYRGPSGVCMRVMGMNVAVIGNIYAIEARDQLVELREPTRGQYRKLILRDRRVLGAILLGDVSAFPALNAAFESNARLSEPQLSELFAPNAIDAKDWPRVA